MLPVAEQNDGKNDGKGIISGANNLIGSLANNVVTNLNNHSSINNNNNNTNNIKRLTLDE